MKTVIAPTGHVHDVVTHEISDRDTARITRALADQGIRVEPIVDIFHVLHLWALVPCTTEQEVRALYAFHEVTDCRIAWHKAVAS